MKPVNDSILQIKDSFSIVNFINYLPFYAFNIDNLFARLRILLIST